jgi:predicted permease
MRRDWLREWRAEITHARRRHAGGRLVVRCLGAFVHAAWLRWDRWRIEMLLQDVKYALRTLTRKPGFAAVTILTLAIGIGANAAIFSAVRAVLFRPLPFPHPDQIVQVSSTTVKGPQYFGGAASPPDFTDWRTNNTSFSEMAAISAGSIPWSGQGQAEQVPYANVTGGFFNVLGVGAMHGRALGYEDDAMGAPDVVVISHQLWARRLGSDPSVIGQSMMLDGIPRRIVGVMPAGLSYPLGTELWIPVRFSSDTLASQRGAHYLEVIARLRPDVTRDAAQAQMATLVRQMAETYPRTNANKAVAIFGLREALVGNVRPALLVLLAAVGFVMLIVCVNVASLGLTRAVGRSRELAVRAALGAGRSRLVNGMLVESVVLAAAGGVAGLLLANWAAQGLAALDSSLRIPLIGETRVDGAVLLFTVLVSLSAALLFGTVPAWHAASRLDVVQRIREGAGTLTAGKERQRLRAGLIVFETALAVLLLVSAGLMMRSFLRMTGVDLGIDTARVQTFNISLPETKYATPQSRAQFVDTLLSRLSANAGVETVGGVFGLPLTQFSHGYTTSTLDGRRLSDDEQDARIVQVRIVTPEYFGVLGIPIVRGRTFAQSDRLGSAAVAVLDERAAAVLWPQEDALGHRFELGTRLGQDGERAGGEVIGIARPVYELGPAGRLRPTVYLAHAQFPVDFMAVTMKARGDEAALVEPARAVLADLDPDLPMFRVRSMDQLAASAVAQPRLYFTLIMLFAVAAVLLAAIGIYGVLAHAVSQRTREIGIRLALGATRHEVIGGVVRQAAWLAVAGLGVGLVFAIAATRYVRSLLFQIEPTDALTYVSVAAALLLVALVASYLPARRASRIDPIVALRE